MDALDPHHMPLTGAQRAHQVTQPVVFAALVNHPGHGRRAARRALAEAVAGLEIGQWQGQHPMTPGGLQCSPQERHQGRRHPGILTTDHGNGPHLALLGIGAAQGCNGLLHLWLRGRRVTREQGLQKHEPMVLTHQAVGRQRRQAMGLALGQALAIERRHYGWLIQQALLYPTQARHQLQVLLQWMTFGQALQARGAQVEQVARRQAQEWRRTCRSLYLSGLEYQAHCIILFCSCARPVARRGSLHGTRVRDASWPRRG
ncbi:hypothetical protein D3C86_1524160 [compost metagenome]